MPAFCAHWPDGSFSIVDADSKTHALIQLDELGDEPAQVLRMDSCLLGFDLTDHGTFRLRQFGEETGPEILETAYPVLKEALGAEAFPEHTIEEQRELVEYAPRAKKALRKAEKTERERLKDLDGASARTEGGEAIQREVGGSGVYIDAIVEHVASKRLSKYKPDKNVKPS